MDLSLKHLRDLVTNVPEASTYSHSVQMLEVAADLRHIYQAATGE